MLTEAMHTRFAGSLPGAGKRVLHHERRKAIHEQVDFRPDSLVVRRANEVLEKTERLLADVRRVVLLEAIASGWFADIRRPADRGKGLLGVREKSEKYFNPFKPVFARHLGLEKEIDTWM
jgi:beta-lysine 5,6-aminomutase alpha subunit